MKLSPEHIQLWKAIHKIMWEEWDPIGVSKIDNWPDDEYNGYTPQIFQLKIQNASEEAIIKQLLRDENIMGVPGNVMHCQKIARKIIAL